jgi:hypothetical protein
MMAYGSSKTNSKEVFQMTYNRVIIEHEKNPALKDLTEANMTCKFEEESFLFEAVDPKTNDKYALFMPRTREKYSPDKSKYYVRKNKIYIALHKQV